MKTDDNEWKRGLPPGPYYKGMPDDYEVYFSPGGLKWHRRKVKTDVLYGGKREDGND